MRNLIPLVCIGVIIGCSSSTTTNPTKDDSEVAKEIRLLIPEAAGGPNKEFEVLGAAGPPKFEEWPNQSISIFALSWHPPKEKADDATSAARLAEFNFIGDGPPNPSAIAKAMSKSKDKGYASIIQPEFITDLTCKVDGDVATGIVTFKAEKLYEGKVEYTARKGDKGWRIEEFRLPAHGITVTRQASGLWKKNSAVPK